MEARSMACEDAETTSDAILSALAGPKRVSGDAGSVEQHSIPDLIAADRYVRSRCGGANPRRGLRITKLVPPGTVSDA
jgi:hypothetical protein